MVCPNKSSFVCEESARAHATARRKFMENGGGNRRSPYSYQTPSSEELIHNRMLASLGGAMNERPHERQEQFKDALVRQLISDANGDLGMAARKCLDASQVEVRRDRQVWLISILVEVFGPEIAEAIFNV